MSPPSVRVNTFVTENEKQLVDPISRVFIYTETLFGLDRLPLVGKKNIYVVLTFLLFVAINTVISTCVRLYSDTEDSVTSCVPTTQNIICGLLSYIRCKWMESFYNELSHFDTEAGCTPKVTIAAIRNMVVTVISCASTVTLFVVPVCLGIFDIENCGYILFVPFYLICVMEVYYIGHLLSLLIPRLKLINYYLESSLSTTTIDRSPVLKEFVYYKSYNPKIAQNSMSKLFDLYQIVVDAYDYLIEGIKWQLLTIIIGDFMTVLGFLYDFSLTTIHGGWVVENEAIYQLGIPIVLLIPLFAPCMFGDSVHSQVKKLRELLASRLYENKLDKSGRSTARALLAFTETRDLSFRLLRMLDIDISLPFKFVGLLVTYLIILLQFEKVINP